MTKVKRLKGMPLHKAVRKIAGKAAQETKFVYRNYRIRYAPIQLNPLLFHGFRSSSRFLFDPQDQGQINAFLKEAQLDQSIIEDAERICSHRFNLLGSGETQLGRSLPWHEDFKTNFRWEPKFYKYIKIVDLENAADVKVPWELSRCQHFFTLGKAYWLTGDEKYAREFQAQVDDWLQHNPVEMSVNWACTMDVAIRAVNWISAVYFFRESPSLEAAFWDRFHTSLYLHGQFIMNNLENTGEHTGNHYLSNLAGLIGLGLYFGDFKIDAKTSDGNDPAAWLAYGLQEMEREMFVQVNEDGSNYEASTSYHRLVAELFLVSTIWCERNGISFSEAYMERLEKMHVFMMQMMKPDGLTPIIGDADDGRYLIVSNYGSWVRNDFRHLLAVAGEFFDRDDFRAACVVASEDALWLAGKFVDASLAQEPVNALGSVAYPDGGYYVLRNSRAYCLIRCGELSFHGQGAHSHNDQLSFELQIDGVDLIVDPGSYVYSADYRMRNQFRSTAMHSTVQAGGFEQNEFEEKNLFKMREETFALCEKFSQDQFIGSHKGFVHKCGVIHKREVILRECELEINDWFMNEGIGSVKSTEMYASFILGPIVAATQDNQCIAFHYRGARAECWIEDVASVQIQDSWLSSQYGVCTSSQYIRAKSNTMRLRTFIRWV
ncbi:alginate lyase family protein [Paenibacillus selenitireducens]|nr:alginate lyase family protein [Paenibacillus selenitireducens]